MLKKKVVFAFSITATIIGFIVAAFVGPAFVALYGVNIELRTRDLSDGWFEYWTETTGYTALFPVVIGIIFGGIALLTTGIIYTIRNLGEVIGVPQNTTRTRKLLSVILALITGLIILSQVGPILAFGMTYLTFLGPLFPVIVVFLPPIVILYWGWGIIGKKA